MRRGGGGGFYCCNLNLDTRHNLILPGTCFKQIIFCFTESFCFTVKIILQGKHNEVSDTFKCCCLTDGAAFHFCLMFREMSILFIYSLWTRGSESRFWLGFCECPFSAKQEVKEPITPGKFWKIEALLVHFPRFSADKFYASIRCDLYFVEKLNWIDSNCPY